MRESQESRKKVRQLRKNKLKSKLLGYTTAASAALAGGQTAEAAISASLNQNIMVLPNQTFDLDINNDGSPDVKFSLNTEGTSQVGGVPFFSTRIYSNPNGYQTVRRFSDLQFRRSASRDDNAYASKIGYGGQIAGSGNLRRMYASSVVDENFMNYGAVNAGQMAYWRSDYFVNQVNSIIKFYKRVGTTGGGFVSYPHPYAANHYGGYNTGPYMSSFGGGQFLGTRGFLGVEFQDAASDTRYAWVDVELAYDFSSLTIHGWAFQTEAGVGIHAGAVPEPSSLALLATGAAGVLASRRRRRKQASEAKST